MLEKDKQMTDHFMENPLPFLNNGVDQIAIIVEDIDRSVTHYERVFGIKPWHFYTYQKPLVKKMSYNGKPADHSNRLALSYFGSMRVELIEVNHGDSIYKDFIKKHGYGIHHLGFLVDNMDEALSLAKKAGFEMIQDGSGFGPDGDGHYAYLDTEDDFGFTIELIERPKRRHPPERIYPDEKSV